MASGRTQASGEGPAPRQVDPRLYDALFPQWTAAARADLPSLGARVARAGSRTTDESQDEAAAAHALVRELVGLLAVPTRIDAESLLEYMCRLLLATVRKYCPEVIPGEPVAPGEVTPPIDVVTEKLQDLVLAAVGVDDKRKRHQVVWEQAGSELLVHLKRTRVAVLDGLVLVGLTVESAETGRTEVTVPFAVGRTDRLAGMVVTTEPVPRGPEVIIDRWGEAITAAAWQILLDVVATLCARIGVDTTGTPLLPGAIVASKGSLRVVPQARHVHEVTPR
jgi:hypothetical protein